MSRADAEVVRPGRNGGDYNHPSSSRLASRHHLGSFAFLLADESRLLCVVHEPAIADHIADHEAHPGPRCPSPSWFYLLPKRGVPQIVLPGVTR